MKKFVKIAFLDRDGVINSSKVNNGYVGLIKDFRWIPGSRKTIKYLKDLGYKVVVVTNQSGIARGYFKVKDVISLHKYIQNELKKIGTKIDKFFYCPFHKDGIIKRYKKKSNLRKPDIGMFLKAKKIWNIDKKNSFIIGDQLTDMQFANKAGIRGYFFDKDNLFLFVKKKIF